MKEPTSTTYEVDASPGRAPIKSWTRGVEFEEDCKEQLRNLASLPFVHHHVAAMPDVHRGIGATVGSVVATRGAIIPAAVGVDIGCGMIASRTDLRAQDLPESLAALRSDIEAAIPHGRSDNGGPGDVGSWKRSIPVDVMVAHDRHLESLSGDFRARYPRILHSRSLEQLGTLGTGNHFIEVCLDEEDRVWVMLHSGSRGQGASIGQRFIELAKEDMRKWFVNLPDKDLAYFPEGTDHFDDYVSAVSWAQEYARINRELMMGAALAALAARTKPTLIIETAINCHHNYVKLEHHFGANVWVTRKGAVRARVGDMGIIPGSMGTRSYIVRGKGNPDSFCSCSHGAGRRMSRTEAKKRFTVADHAKATAHVECRKDADVVDETPGAYKDVDAVMQAQGDLVEIVHTLKQVLCVKG